MVAIRHSSDLRNKYNEISDFCNQFNDPVFITKNETGDLVLRSNAEYPLKIILLFILPVEMIRQYIFSEYFITAESGNICYSRCNYMGLLNLASYKSVWRGYEYFNKKYVVTHIKNSPTEIKGVVRGSGQNHYDVFIDLEHPRKSKCNCPHADGKRIICKHMIALYFAAYPNEAKKYYEDVIKYQEEEDRRQEELVNKVINYVHKLKKSELEQLLLQVLFDGPEWQYDRFIRENIEW